MPKNAANQKSAKAKSSRKVPENAADRAVTFSILEKNILISKGVTEAQIRTMIKKGIRCRDDFKHVGDAGTLAALKPFSDGFLRLAGTQLNLRCVGLMPNLSYPGGQI